MAATRIQFTRPVLENLRDRLTVAQRQATNSLEPFFYHYRMPVEDMRMLRQELGGISDARSLVQALARELQPWDVEVREAHELREPPFVELRFRYVRLVENARRELMEESGRNIFERILEGRRAMDRNGTNEYVIPMTVHERDCLMHHLHFMRLYQGSHDGSLDYGMRMLGLNATYEQRPEGEISRMILRR